MALWVDKYRPNQLDALDFHQDLAKNLLNLVKSGNFPHLLFYGANGAGKSTRIRCILKELYGTGADNIRMEYRHFETNSHKKLELMILSSLFHIEVTPSDVGIYDRIVVQELIKQMAQSQQIDTNAQKPFKVVVLTEADTLSKEAQHALRRTMEKYAGTCKIMMCCTSVSKIIEPLRSRCMVIRIPGPNREEMTKCLKDVALAEKLEVTDRFLRTVVERSNSNLRRGILLLECAATQYGKKNLDAQKIIEPDWQVYVRDTATIILNNCTSDGLVRVRSRLFDTLTRCIPTYLIFEELVDALLPHCDATIRHLIISAAAQFEHTAVLGSKAIFHLDAFVATFMAIYKNHQLVLNNR